MQVWNVLHAARWKYRTQKSTPAHHHTTLSGYIFATKALSTIGKKVAKEQYLLHMLSQYGELQPTNGWDQFGSLGHPSKFQWISHLGFVTASMSLMFDRLLVWYTIYTFSGALVRWRNFSQFKIHFTSNSCVLLYWQRYCTALQQRAWAKLCGMVQGMELRNFRRGPHLYSAGRQSYWASAHILVLSFSSPIHSGQRLDVYHTSTHDVALSTHDVALVWI